MKYFSVIYYHLWVILFTITNAWNTKNLHANLNGHKENASMGHTIYDMDGHVLLAAHKMNIPYTLELRVN